MPTLSLSEEYSHVVKDLSELETKLRIKYFPSLVERAPPLEADDIHIQNGATKTFTCCEEAKEKDITGSTTSAAAATTVPTTAPVSRESEMNKNVLAIVSKCEDGSFKASLRKRNLRTFWLTMIPCSSLESFSNLISLDVSHNELMDIPGLSSMCNLQTLNLERGWFNTLPLEIGSCTNLITINASRNFLRPNNSSLLFDKLKSLKHLRNLDLTYNQKCGTITHCQHIQQHIPQLSNNVQVTLWENIGKNPGSYIGSSAAERDSTLLRSQLEPWSTVSLRKRLVQDFGQEPTDASLVDRAQVMSMLLHCYYKEGLMSFPETLPHSSSPPSSAALISPNNTNYDILNHGKDARPRIYVNGTSVDPTLIDKILIELRLWTKETMNNNKNKCYKNRERPSIDARNYMILRAPNNSEKKKDNSSSSRRAIRQAKKFQKYQKIWDLALQALKETDSEFATRCTEIAVTYGFQGSPHIDKQNCGPFYGFALGNFRNGTGGVCVECSTRVVAVVNTKNRIGRIDGRYPHWVDQYGNNERDPSSQHEHIDNTGNINDDAAEDTDDNTTKALPERYSLVYYETGRNFAIPGPAIFSIPERKQML